MYKHILIATDGSELAHKGVNHGLSLAKALGAKVTVVTVTESFPVYPGQRYALPPEELERFGTEQSSFAQNLLSSIETRATEAGIPCVTHHIPDSRVADAILELATKTDASLIVMSSHGRRGVEKLLLGSQAQEVLVRSHVPVLVVR